MESTKETPKKTGLPPISDAISVEHISWRDFMDNTTFHGVRYIFDKRGLKFRRHIWLLVVMTALSVFVIQVGIRTRNYLEYKTTLDVTHLYKDQLEFPAVTICNQNRHRTTAVVEQGLYDVVEEVFKTGNISKIPWETFGSRVNGIDYGEFTLKTGHQKHTFIDSCIRNGIECDIERDFNAVLTDLGLCYTFNGQANISTVHTLKAGAGSGLKLVINVEQYEYMRGPQSDAGMKILLHSPEEIPIMQEQGFAAAPGSHTLVAMKRSEISTLQPPYGMCHPDNSPVSQCYAQCQARHISNACQCQTEHMHSFNKNATEMTKSELKCACKPPCKQVRYESQLSYAQLSKVNIDRLILDNLEKQKILEESHLEALETTQRNSDEIKKRDTEHMTKILMLAERLYFNLEDIRKMTTEVLNSEYYHLPTIIDLKPYRKDVKTIEDGIDKWRKHYFFDSIESLLSYITNLEEDIPEWDGIGFRFEEFLNICLKEVTAGQQNGNSDGSGDVDLDYSNNTILLHVPHKCKVKIQSLESMLQSLDFQQFELYQKIVGSIFENSTESPEAVDQHNVCMDVLGLEVPQAFPALLSGFQNFSKVQTLENYVWTTKNIILSAKVLFGLHTNLTMCLWVQNILYDMWWKTYAKEDHLTRIENSFIYMFKTVVSMDQDFELVGKPIYNIITKYLNENVTKIELARHMHSQVMAEGMEKLSEFEREGSIVIKSLQEELTDFKVRLATVYVTVISESAVPIMTVEQLKNLEFFKMSYNTNRTELQHLIDGLHENITNVQRLLDLVFSEYQLSFQHLTALPAAFKDLSDHLTMLQDDLQVYAESTSLNVNFFMDNFLQLDIFYKDMSYEVITQQEAFGLLSLLGEVGGFLGLLLGASLITVCEWFDYLLLYLAARCARCGEADRDVVDVESAGNH